MNLTIKKLSVLIIGLFCISACATNDIREDLPTIKKEVHSFQDVVSDVSNLSKKYGEAKVLVVLDIDNTILTSSVDIGGDIWYQWQRGKLELKPSQEQVVSCLFEDSIGLLYELGPMNLTEEKIPAIISGWQANGISLMALTSRAPKYRAATERELVNKGIDFEVTALAPTGKKSPVYREVKGRELSYMKGVMMTSGMNKGEMLTYLLERTGREFDAIVFVDDSQKNIDNLYQEFESRGDIDFNIYHYTKVESDRENQYGTVLTESQAEKMANDWNELNRTLNMIFPQRKLDSGCLSID